MARIAAPSARVFANDVKALLEEARYEAVRRHTPVAVRWSGSSFETRVQPTTALTFDVNVCTSGTVIRTHDASDFRSVTVSGSMTAASGGIVWMPSGLVRTCAGADLTTNATVVVTDPRAPFTLTLWPAGAVTGP